MKQVLILDCETISLDYNCICDIAWGIVRRNKMVEVKNFIVLEHLDKMAVGNFSAPKMSATMQEVKNGNAQIKPFLEIMRELAKDFQASTLVYAYNATFDRNAIIKTCKALQENGAADFFQEQENFEKWRDLWAWATHTILFKKSFVDFCEANDLLTKTGRCSTSAETTLKFLKNDVEYVEMHTARADVLDEFEIYKAIKITKKAEFADVVDDKNDFKGSPSYNIERFKRALDE